MKIAIQGDPGSFSYVATLNLFGEQEDIISCESFHDLFEKLTNREVNKGVIPIENSLTGRIGIPTHLLIKEKNLSISNEIYLPIDHYLLSNSDIPIHELEEIYGHPEALSQCSLFLMKLSAKKISYYDGASALRHVKKNKHSSLIASRKMSDLNNLNILAENIQDISWNQTRFFVIEPAFELILNSSQVGSFKSTIVFSVKHSPGTLYEILEVFKNFNINLTRLESMPSRENPWEYFFLLDFEGHINSEKCQKVIAIIIDKTRFFKILGSYPSNNGFIKPRYEHLTTN